MASPSIRASPPLRSLRLPKVVRGTAVQSSPFPLNKATRQGASTTHKFRNLLDPSAWIAAKTCSHPNGPWQDHAQALQDSVSTRQLFRVASLADL